MGDGGMPKYATDLKDAGVLFKNIQVIADFFYEKPDENAVEKEVNHFLRIKNGLAHNQYFSTVVEAMQND